MKRNITILLFLAIGLIFGFGMILDSYIDGGRIILIDQQIYKLFLSIHQPWLDGLMRWITVMGNWQIIAFSTLLGGSLLYVAKKEKYLQALLFSVCSGLLFTESMKILVSRQRPPLANMIIDQGGYAFPSGHSYFAVGFYGLVTYFWIKHFRKLKYKILFFILGSGCCLLIGISRIYLGVHWTSDVVGGFLSSGSWLTVSIAYLEYKTSEYKEFNHQLVWRGFWLFTILWLASISLVFSVQK